MIKIGFAQPNFRTGPKVYNSYYLPYSVGCLWAYAKQDQTITENFVVHHWAWNRSNQDQILSECDIVCFSQYSWNRAWTNDTAKNIKELNPNTFIIFGGPDVDYGDPLFELNYPYVDTVIQNEGEVAFKELLLDYLHNKPIDKKIVASRVREALPSVYLSGVFDELIEQYPDVAWTPTLESDRGCPYECTFCDWGQLTGVKMIKTDLQRVFDELEWIGQQKMDYLSMTNSNFGAFKDRDLQIASKIVEVNKKYGFPKAMGTSYAKNSNDVVVDIVKKITDSGIQNALVLSLQSTDTEVLQLIKRKNLKSNKLEEVTELANKVGVNLITELIIGLPGDTLCKFKKSVTDVFEHGLHNGSDTFLLQIFPNAPMMEDVEKFQLEFFTTYDLLYETNPEEQEEVKERVEGIPTIKSNNTMTNDDIKQAMLFAWCAQGLHVYGFSRHLSIYLNKVLGVSYLDFYNNLLEHFKTQHHYIQSLNDVLPSIADFFEKGMYSGKIKDVEIAAWQVAWTYPLVVDNLMLVDSVVDDIISFVRNNYDVPEAVLHDCKILPYNMFKRWDNYIYGQKEIQLHTNIVDFANGTEDFCIKPTTYIVEDRWQDFPESFAEYVDSATMKRRRAWASNKIFQKPN